MTLTGLTLMPRSAHVTAGVQAAMPPTPRQASPQVATREHVEERHERDKAEHSPRELRNAPDIAAGGQVDPYQDHGDGMEETDQELEDLLHYPNLPAARGAPVRSPRLSAERVRAAERPRCPPNPCTKSPARRQ